MKTVVILDLEIDQPKERLVDDIAEKVQELTDASKVTAKWWGGNPEMSEKLGHPRDMARVMANIFNYLVGYGIETEEEEDDERQDWADACAWMLRYSRTEVYTGDSLDWPEGYSRLDTLYGAFWRGDDDPEDFDDGEPP